MALDYSTIKKDNVTRYGTDIGRIGKMLLENRYDDRVHFIYEILQNAEDALKRRQNWKGSRSVKFYLSKDRLVVSHYGEPFTESDIRGICGIGESTKTEMLTSIGRFGIGFKSVYAFTDLPEIHSGQGSFAIESYVWPREIESKNEDSEKTVFIFPFKEDDCGAFDDVEKGLRELGSRTLLFLREIDEISWSIEDGQSGLYLRDNPEQINENCRKVILVGQQEGYEDIEESWLIFSNEIFSEEKNAGHVEIAFALDTDDDEDLQIIPIPDSTLVAYFSTIVATNLGFLMQGPYRTTPSRDNVPRNDKWNKYLVHETSVLLKDALHVLRDKGLLGIKVLQCLPLNSDHFSEDSMFKPLYDSVCTALESEPLLPCSDGSYTSAKNAKLARTRDVQELLSSEQLKNIYDHEEELKWLTGDITLNTTPELRQYLMRDLDITEVSSEMLILKLSKKFLEIQTDEWITKLYEFYNAHGSLRDKLKRIPLIRLEDNKHVPVFSVGKLQAFLPSAIDTSFPTVRRTVCDTAEAKQFLESLGLTIPDPVDDVVRNVLPMFSEEEIEDEIHSYEKNIQKILTAFATDSIVQKSKLVKALQKTSFVRAKDTGNGSKYFARPGSVYLASDRIKKLFSGVNGLSIVDDDYGCLRGESIRELLLACGTERDLKRVPIENKLSHKELLEIRRNAGLEKASRETPIIDYTLMGLRELIRQMSSICVEDRREKASLLWESLVQLVARRGAGVLKIDYTWGYSHTLRTEQLDADFVRQLNTVAWIPDEEGELQRPEFVLFASLGWKPNPVLLSNIQFKPPIIEALAKEAGFEPEMLDLLKKLGVTSIDELKKRFEIDEQVETSPTEDEDESEVLAPILKGKTGENTLGVAKAGGDFSGGGIGAGENGNGTRVGGHSGGGNKRTPGSKGGRPFISYIGTHPENGSDNENDHKDGLDHHKRLELEEKAIKRILSEEPCLEFTPTNNPGFDLYERKSDGSILRRVEVKAMAGSFYNRTVGLSRTQFECARVHGEAFWLYVVENVEDEESARVFRIKNPAGKAHTFTFDHGWIEAAEGNEN